MLISFLLLSSVQMIRSNRRIFQLFRCQNTLQMNAEPDILTDNTKHRKVIVLAGATSSGKSAVVEELCKRFDSEIVIADSVQIYKYLDIGSNKPTTEEMKAAPHHLVDMLEPGDKYSSGEFARAAAATIFDILARDKVPIVVGGNTMWIQWLVHGLPDAPKSVAEKSVEAQSIIRPFKLRGNFDQAKQILEQYNSVKAASLVQNDWYRLERSLEIELVRVATQAQEEALAANVKSVGFTEKRREPVLPGLDVRCFFLTEDRQTLYHTMDSRCEAMLLKGFLEEVATLLIDGKLPPDSIAAKAIGYRQAIAYLFEAIECPNNLKALELFVRNFSTATRNYGRRQMKWYRTDEAFLWLKIFRGISSSPSKLSSNPAKRISPYRTIADEIQHWLSIPRSHFDRLLSDQFRCGEAASKIRSRRSKSCRQQNKTQGAIRGRGGGSGQFDDTVSSPETNPATAAAVLSRYFEGLSGDELRDDESGRAVAYDVTEKKFSEAQPSPAVYDLLAAAALLQQGEIASSPFPSHPRNELSASSQSLMKLEPTWSAEDVLIRASEGSKGSKVLRQYAQTLTSTADEAQWLLSMADSCASRIASKFTKADRQSFLAFLNTSLDPEPNMGDVDEL